MPKIYIERSFREVGGKGEGQILTSEELAHIPYGVVLGEPGAGKTSFLTKAYPNISLFQSSEILSDPECMDGHGGVLIDAFDEFRQVGGYGGDIFELRKVLRNRDITFFRLACRKSDWKDSDTSALQVVFPDLRVFSLCPFSDEDIQKYLSEAGIELCEKEVLRLKKQGLHEILRFPLQLEMFTNVFKRLDGDFTKEHVFEESVKDLALEHDPDRDIKFDISLEEVIDLASKVFAYFLLTNSSDLGKHRRGVNDSTLVLEQIGGTNVQLAEELVKTKLFVCEGDRFYPFHRSVAEYLAAKFLIQLKEDLPFGLWKTIFASERDESLPTLRGLFAWVVCMLSDSEARGLIRADPEGILKHGDVSSWPSSKKNLVLESLVNAMNEGKTFWEDGGRLIDYSQLTDENTEPRIISLIKNSDINTITRRVLIESLGTSKSISQEAEKCLKEVFDGSYNPYEKAEALEGLINQGIFSAADTGETLARIRSGEIHDTSSDEMRGLCLIKLYPDHLGIDELVSSFTMSPGNTSGLYRMFISYKLPNLIPEEDYIDFILQSATLLKNNGDYSGSITSSRGHLDIQDVVEKILPNLLNNLVQQPVNKILQVLLSLIDEHGVHLLNNPSQRLIRGWIDERPKLMLSLLHEFWNDEMDFAQLHRFNLSVCGANFSPSFFARFIEIALDATTSDVSSEVAIILAIRLASNLPERDMSEAINQIFNAFEQRPKLKELSFIKGWDGIAEPLPSWRIGVNSKHANYEEDRKENFSKHVEAVLSNINEAVNIKNHPVSDYVGAMYFGEGYQEYKTDIVGIENIKSFLGEEGVNAFEMVMNNLVAGVELDSPKVIAQLAINKRRFRHWLVLAAYNELYKTSPEKCSSIPAHAKRSIMAYMLSDDRLDVRGYDAFISMCVSEPELFLKTLIEYYESVCLEREPQKFSVTKLASISEYEVPVRGLIQEMLSRETKFSAEFLWQIMEAGLKVYDRRQLYSLLKGYNKNIRVSLVARFYLLLLNDEDIFLKIVCKMPRKLELRRLFVSALSTSEARISDLTLEHKYKLFKELYSAVNPYRSLEFGYARDIDSLQEVVLGLLHSMSNDTSDMSNQVLAQLSSSCEDEEWRERINQALVRQRRGALRASKPWSCEELNRLVSTGTPRDARGLQRLLCFQLEDISTYIQTSSLNRYKNFWQYKGGGSSVDSRTPKIENDCRDYIIELLNAKLQKLGVFCEREGSYKDETRADIKSSLGSNIVLPIEVKKQDHQEVLCASESQLLKKYMIDPLSSGLGIYLVLWFGASFEVHGYTKYLNGKKPQSASEMKTLVETTIPEGQNDNIRVVVIDCSWS